MTNKERLTYLLIKNIPVNYDGTAKGSVGVLADVSQAILDSGFISAKYDGNGKWTCEHIKADELQSDCIVCHLSVVEAIVERWRLNKEKQG